MKDTLRSQREYFAKRLEQLSKVEDPEVRNQRESDLTLDEDCAEFAYRSGLIRGKIMGLGLEQYMSEIIDGMNKSCSKVDLDLIMCSAEDYQQIGISRNDAFLRLGLDYVDRWVMYNNLFKNKKVK